MNDNNKKCPQCGTVLNNDELASGKCFTCSATFESTITNHIDYEDKNAWASIIKTFASILFFVDIVSIFVLLYCAYDGIIIFSIALISIFSCLLLFGFAEIINILHEINKKPK